MPMLAPTSSDSSSTTNGSLHAGEQPRRELLEPSGRRCARPGSTANSSPPRRATRPSGPTDVGEPRAELAQQHVAVVVAEGVVDLLEAVEVHQHHGERAPVCAEVAISSSTRVAETLAVGQPGELVRRRHPVQLLAPVFGLQQLADEVLEDDEHQAEQREADRAQSDRQVDGGHRQQRREQLGGEQRRERLARLLRERRSIEIALVAGDTEEVQSEREDERREHEQVVAESRPELMCSRFTAAWKNRPPASGNQAKVTRLLRR